MPKGILKNVAVRGVACAVPKTIVEASKSNDIFGEENVSKFVKMTGVRQRHVASEKQTASDLAFVAAQNLIEHLKWEIDSIDGVVFVTQSPDYKAPATACVLHGRLGLKKDCIAFDVNLGCSGFVYGVYIAGSLMQTGDTKRVLFLGGDTSTKGISFLDKSAAMLFGDAGFATALEFDETSKIPFCYYTDGTGYKSIITPVGACRNPNGSQELREFGEGVIRSDYDLYMNGAEVFDFTITEVPKMLKSFMAEHNISENDYDLFAPHQANVFMLKHIAKKVKIPLDKLGVSMDRYGNTSVTSIPITICDTYGGKEQGNKKILAPGFGIGLSWGTNYFDILAENCLPIIETNSYFEDGGIVID
ncbi:3-oxoacyl-ACP synthase [Paenibacillus silvae]|uniref:3-oxoacyl-ACP synthase n=1 Tax=Paenibacillus silvae TaxID=1325358 RepID=A0ABQ1ZI24_9BACL|nr:ketoacyl-ACP synthase III [Paenibacillus silvae]GGH64364.1 3-oxoacyl-ACP synthase [Paenibacillus silvae]